MGRKGRNAVCSGLSLPKTGPMIEGKIIIAEVLPRSEGLEPYISFPSLGVLYQDEKPPECLTLEARLVYRRARGLKETSVQFSCSVLSDSLRPHELQHAKPPCLSPTHGVYSNSCPSSRWCHQPSHPLSSPSPPALNLSQHQGLGISWPKYWSFSFSISPSNEYSGLISFRMDLLDLLSVQGTLKSLLQLHSSKASIFQCSAFLIVQLSHPCMTTGKTIALTRWTFAGKVKSLLFNMLSRLVITFLLRSKCLLISWFQSPSALILEPPQNKVCHCFHCLPIYLPWSDGTGCHDLSFLNAEL